MDYDRHYLVLDTISCHSEPYYYSTPLQYVDSYPLLFWKKTNKKNTVKYIHMITDAYAF